MEPLVLIGAASVLVLFAIILVIIMVSFDKKTNTIANVLSNHRNAIRTIEKLVKKIEDGDENPDVVDVLNKMSKRLDRLEDYMHAICNRLDIK